MWEFSSLELILSSCFGGDKSQESCGEHKLIVGGEKSGFEPKQDLWIIELSGLATGAILTSLQLSRDYDCSLQ